MCEYNGAEALTIADEQKYRKTVHKARKWIESKGFNPSQKVNFWTALGYETDRVTSKYDDDGSYYIEWYDERTTADAVSTSNRGGLVLVVSPVLDKYTGLVIHPDVAWAFPICEISRDDFVRLGYGEADADTNQQKNQVTCSKCPKSQQLFTII